MQAAAHGAQTCSSCRASTGRTPDRMPPSDRPQPAPRAAVAARPGQAGAYASCPACRTRTFPGVRPLELDLYLPPSGDAPVPAVVFLHGGGWRLGSRRSLGPAYAGATPHPFEQVAAAGIAVASADYRLSGEQTWPAQAARRQGGCSLAAGARRTRSALDAERIGAWGESAGGHLALLLGLTGTVADLDGDVGMSVRRARSTRWRPGTRRATSAPCPAISAPIPRRPGHPRGAAVRRTAERRAGSGPRGQPDHLRLAPTPHRSCCCTARFRPADPLGPECTADAALATVGAHVAVRDLSGCRPHVAGCSRGRGRRPEPYGHVLPLATLSDRSRAQLRNPVTTSLKAPGFSRKTKCELATLVGKTCSSAPGIRWAM